MRNTVLSYLFLPLFACLSSNVSAALQTPVVAESIQVVPSEKSSKVSLNDADALTLQKALAGIGKAKAEAIVAYREANGPFESVDELLEIKGIGKALLERNRDKLVVE